MTKISLKEIIDDILLLVRNNNISESEDLSRAQIASWVDAYRRYFWKQHADQLKEQLKRGADLENVVDDEVLKIKETGPHKLVDVESDDENPTFTKVTEDTFEHLLNDAQSSVLAIHDQDGCNIQYMDHMRRHYHYFRKYTFGELTAYYKDDKHIYVQGIQDDNDLRYIYVLAVYEVEDDDQDDAAGDDPDEDNVKIPAWMVPSIKEAILKNELAFMLNRPSDDSNNSTLASVKPHGPQDDEE